MYINFEYKTPQGLYSNCLVIENVLFDVVNNVATLQFGAYLNYTTYQQGFNPVQQFHASIPVNLAEVQEAFVAANGNVMAVIYQQALLLPMFENRASLGGV